MKKETIEIRLDNIEEILKMLLVNSMMDNVDSKIREDIIYELRNKLFLLGIKNIRMYYIENKYYLFAEIDSNENIKAIKNKYLQASEMLDKIELVLVFDKIHPKRKKSFDEHGISYFIKNSEMKIGKR